MRRVKALILTSVVAFLGVINLARVSIFNPGVEKILETEAYSYLPDSAKDYIRKNYAETGKVILTERNKEENTPYLNPAYISYLETEKSNDAEFKNSTTPPVIIVDYQMPTEKIMAKNGTPSISTHIAQTKDGISYYSSAKNTVSEPEILPSKFDLREVETETPGVTESFISDLKDQNPLGICWAFASAEQAESYIMLNVDEEPFNSNSTLISTRQIDYAASSDGIKNIFNANGIYREYAKTDGSTGGGNYIDAATVFANGVSLVEESDFLGSTWNNFRSGPNWRIEFLDYGDITFTYSGQGGPISYEDFIDSNGRPITKYLEDQRDLTEVFNYGKSKYEANNTVSLDMYYDRSYGPIYTNEERESIIATVKSAIKNNGGVYNGGQAVHTNCGAANTMDPNNMYVLDTESVCAGAGYFGHATQIIGWDDNYEYNYCSGPSHTPTIYNEDDGTYTCSSGEVVGSSVESGPKGAFIVRNSYGEGTAVSYFYIAYTSMLNEIGYINNLTSMNDRNWDNNYYSSYTYYDVSSQQKGFARNTKVSEQVKSVKFNTITYNADFKVSLLDSENEEIASKTIHTTLPGYYTVDFSDSEAPIVYGSNENIIVKVENTTEDKNAYFWQNSISVFTSNMDSAKDIISGMDKILEVPEVENGKYTFNLYYETRGIEPGEELNVAIFSAIYDGDEVDNGAETPEIHQGEPTINVLDPSLYTVTNNTVGANSAFLTLELDDDENVHGVYAIAVYHENDEEEIDAFDVNYINIGNETHTINFETANYTSYGEFVLDIIDENGDPVSQSPTNSATIEINPLTGNIIENGVETSNTLIGATAFKKSGYEDYIRFDHWTSYITYAQCTEGSEECLPIGTIVEDDSNGHLTLGYADDDVFEVYSNVTYYLNFEERDASLTFQTEISGWNEDEDNILYGKLQIEEEASLYGNVSYDITSMTGNAKTSTGQEKSSPFYITASLPSDNKYYDDFYFDGWYIKDTDTKITSDTTLTPTKLENEEVYKDTIYVAKWASKQTVIVVNSNETTFGSPSNPYQVYDDNKTDNSKLRYWQEQHAGDLDNSAVTSIVDLHDETQTAIPASEDEAYTYHFIAWTSSLVVNDGVQAFTLTANFGRTEKEYALAFKTEISGWNEDEDNILYGKLQVEGEASLYGNVSYDITSVSGLSTSATSSTKDSPFSVAASLPSDNKYAEDFHFDGWYIESTNTKVSSETTFVPGKPEGSPIYRDMAYVAKWAPNQSKFEVESNNTSYGEVNYIHSQDQSSLIDDSRIRFWSENLTQQDFNSNQISDPTGTIEYSATPTENNAAYEYYFNNWTTSKRNQDDNNIFVLTANFSRDEKVYTLLFGSNIIGWNEDLNDELDGLIQIEGSSASYGEVEYGVYAVSGYSTINSSSIAKTSPLSVTASLPSENKYAAYFEFDGWYIHNTDTKVSSETSFVPTKLDGNDYYADTHYVAVWKAKKFNIIIRSGNEARGSVTNIYSDDGGTIDQSEYIYWINNFDVSNKNNQTITDPFNQVHEAQPKQETDEYTYTFKEWQISNDTSAIYFTAYFNEEVKKYTVLFVIDNPEYGTVSVNSRNVEYGTKMAYSNSDKKFYFGRRATPEVIDELTVTASEMPKTAEYVYSFDGWEISEPLTVTKDIIVTAKFSRAENTVDISFMTPEHGSYQESSTIYPNYGQTLKAITGTPVTITAIPDTGYHFLKWQKQIVGIDETYLDCMEECGSSPTITPSKNSDNIFVDVKYLAIFEANTYSVTFDAKGGSSVASKNVAYGNKVNEPAEPTKQYYIFENWYKDSSRSELWHFESDIVTEDITLYANWTLDAQGIPATSEGDLDFSNGAIRNIQVGKTAGELKNAISYEATAGHEIEYTVRIVSSDDETILEDEDKISTGTRSQIIGPEGEIIFSIANIINGDTNGDGLVTYMDYVKIYNHIKKTKNPESDKNLLEGVYFLAGDMSGDGEITYLDYVKVYNKIKAMKEVK